MSAELVLIRKDKVGFVGGVERRVNFDPFVCQIMSSESLKLQSNPSKFPVEAGLDMSDNIVSMPKTLTITGLITTQSISQSILTVGGIFTNGVGGLASIAWEKVFKTQTNFSKLAKHSFGIPQTADDARDTLQTMWENREVVDVLTSVYDLKNMAIVNVAFPRSSKNSHKSLIFTLTFKEIREFEIFAATAEATTKDNLSTTDASASVADEGAGDKGSGSVLSWLTGKTGDAGTKGLGYLAKLTGGLFK